MGSGAFDSATGRFNLILSARYAATAAELLSWRDAFVRASALLFDATDGQHQFGNIYISNKCAGGGNADMWLLQQNGTSLSGDYAVLNSADNAKIHATLYNQGITNPLAVIVHEFGHYAYGLRDEYNTVCLGDNPPTGACIMEAEVVALELDGQTASEFCSAANHNVASGNYQQLLNEESCWNTMKLGPKSNPGGYPDLQLPATDALPGQGPAPAGTPQGMWPTATPPTWTILAPQQRFVLVIDRSGSMQGNKLIQAKFGAHWWVGYTPPPPSEFDDPDSSTDTNETLCIDPVPFYLGIISYSHTVSPVPDFELQLIPDDEVRTDAHEAIDDIEAGGGTAIGDGLRSGLNQILGAGPRAATQVIVLLTDGLHNSGTEEPEDVLEDLISNGVRVYTIGIGETIDPDLLDLIAERTGGEFYRINPNLPQDQQEDQIRAKMEDISGTATENGGIVTTLVGSTNPGIREEEVRIEQTSSSATFGLSWRNPDDLLHLELQSPGGDRITLESETDGVRLIYSQRPYMGFQVAAPEPGIWKLIVKPLRVNKIAHYRLFVFCQNSNIDGGILIPKQCRCPGDTIPVHFQCYFKQPISGLNVQGAVVTPGGGNIPIEFSEHDPRIPPELQEDDGIYYANFDKTFEPGMYTLNVIAESDGESTKYSASKNHFAEEGSLGPIPAFRRQFSYSLAIGKEVLRRVQVDPNTAQPGQEVRVKVTGTLTHFRQNHTTFDFGEGIEVSKIDIVDRQTALITLLIGRDAQPGLRNIRVTSEVYKESIEVEGGFNIVHPARKWSINTVIGILLFVILLLAGLLIIAIKLLMRGD